MTKAKATMAKVTLDDIQAQFNALRQDVLIKFNHLKTEQDKIKEAKAVIDRHSIGQKAFARVLRLEDDYAKLIKGNKRRIKK